MIFDKWENLHKFAFSQQWSDIIDDVYALRRDILNSAYAHDLNILDAQVFLKNFQETRYPLRYNAFLNTMAFCQKQENAYEAHRKFVDIHFVIHGEERIEIASTSDILAKKAHKETDVYNEEKDYVFFTKPYKADACVSLNKTNFLIAMPEDAHATCLALDCVTEDLTAQIHKDAKVTVKGIVKIPVEWCV